MVLYYKSISNIIELIKKYLDFLNKVAIYPILRIFAPGRKFDFFSKSRDFV